MASDTDLAKQALAVAAEVVAQADTRRHQQAQHPTTTSGEFQAVIIALVGDLKVDSREHRQKLEDILVRLAEGNGRMDRIETQGVANRDRLTAIESRIATVEHTGTDTSAHLRGVEKRLESIENGNSSGLQKAVKLAVAEAVKPPTQETVNKPVTESRQRRGDLGFGLNISNALALKLLAVLGTIATAIIGGYFALREKQVEVQAPTPAAHAPAQAAGKTP
jgi:chromosome segregation ATPase